ncbi:MAG: hypothetical protein ACK4RF_04970 [Cyclobacteriaceae bacterium]
MKFSIIPVLILFILSSCASLIDLPKYQLSNGYYDFRQEGNTFKKKCLLKLPMIR